MKISVILSTYNSPAWLEKVLWGYRYQTDDSFEVIVADDGSTDETRELVERFATRGHLSIQHVWQPDAGFQKCRILNKAIVASIGEYIIATDGDCVPRKDFVAVHRKYAAPGYFLSGGYFKLPLDLSRKITPDDIKTGRAFDPEWLIANGLKKRFKNIRLSLNPTQAEWFNLLSTTNMTWNGHNASGWKADALRVNGFDERMQYGGEDCEFGGRLLNAGIKAKRIRYSAITMHLDHLRSYESDEVWQKNRKIRRTSIKEKLIETPAGIRQWS